MARWPQGTQSKKSRPKPAFPITKRPSLLADGRAVELEFVVVVGHEELKVTQVVRVLLRRNGASVSNAAVHPLMQRNHPALAVAENRHLGGVAQVHVQVLGTRV